MNDLKGTRIEFHILQSFPVTCLNRDDVGSPKTAIVGGMERARVSSQCWKRQVRLALRDLGVELGVRTRDLAGMLKEAMLEAGASESEAEKCSSAIAPALSSDKTLLFFSKSEAAAIAAEAKKNDFDGNKLVKDKKLTGETKKAIANAFNPAADGLDIALFGRMVAQDADMNIQAAASFAHAISTHKSANEVEFFTALDDRSAKDESGSAHMGTLEFNSATYYRYVSLDLGQLQENLQCRDLGKAVEAFVKALYQAVPSARQTTQAGLRPWDFARVQIRKGQGMQVSFEKPVESKNGFLEPSIERLNKSIETQAARSGSLYGAIPGQDYMFGGEDIKLDGVAGVNIDELAKVLADFVKTHEKS